MEGVASERRRCQLQGIIAHRRLEFDGRTLRRFRAVFVHAQTLSGAASLREDKAARDAAEIGCTRRAASELADIAEVGEVT